MARHSSDKLTAHPCNRGSLQACVAAVVLAHVALVGGLARLPVSGDPGRHQRKTPVMQLVRVGVSSPPPEQPLLPERQELPRQASSGASSDSSPPTTPVAPAPETRSPAPVEEFRSPSEVDTTALPRSAPDTRYLEGPAWSGVPMRLRLFIDAHGKVVDVKVLVTYDDPSAVEQVRQMFLATGFTPARAHGEDVASYKDIELAVGESE